LPHSVGNRTNEREKFEIRSRNLRCPGKVGIVALMRFPPLPRSFYARDPVVVARGLLGKWLLAEEQTEDREDNSPPTLVGGRIVEAEAYLSSRDSACHASRGMTPRCATMFGPAGHAYVYAIHSRWCLNAVTEEVGQGSAVLIRAIEPLLGIEAMRARRGSDMRLLDLARGPARLCEALGVARPLDGWDLTLGQRLWISDTPPIDEELAKLAGETRIPRIRRSRRIGVTSAQSRLLRFFWANCPFVSGARGIAAVD
jgi:DNA-3-methyladenine glycosylase